MNCEQTGELLYDYSKGLLEPSIASDVAAHVKTCENCFEDYNLMLLMHKKFKCQLKSPSGIVLYNIRKASGFTPFILPRPVLALSAAALIVCTVFGASIALRYNRINQVNSYLNESYSSIYEGVTDEYSDISQSYLKEIGLDD